MEVNEIGNKYVGMDSSMLMEMAHSKHASESQKVAAVSQQFESVLVTIPQGSTQANVQGRFQ